MVAAGCIIESGVRLNEHLPNKNCVQDAIQEKPMEARLRQASKSRLLKKHFSQVALSLLN